MNLETIPLTVWEKLASVAIDAKAANKDISTAVANHFYDQIYSTWSMDKVKYAPNLVGGDDGGWSEMVDAWKAMGNKNLGDELGDDSVGKAHVQIDKVKGKVTASEATKMARLWEIYNDKKVGSRFQFVVEAGAGMPLFNRMRRACQTYIKNKLQGKPNDFIVHGWKVFGEAAGIGRSDSCVVYLRVPYEDPAVADAVQNYIWKEISDLVDDQFVPLGFFRVGGKPVWALDVPDGAKEKAILGHQSHSSAGGYMSNVLSKAIEMAIGEESDKQKIIAKAKTNAAELVKKLFQ